MIKYTNYKLSYSMFRYEWISVNCEIKSLLKIRLFEWLVSKENLYKFE